MILIMSITANSIEGAAYIDRGWVAKVFRKDVEANEPRNQNNHVLKSFFLHLGHF